LNNWYLGVLPLVEAMQRQVGRVPGEEECPHPNPTQLARSLQ
jgi:hypothetical protein